MLRALLQPQGFRVVPKRLNQFKASYLDQKRPANYEPLTVISLLNHTALHYPTKMAYVHGNVKATWKELHERVKRFSSALVKLGVVEGDVVSIIAPNTPSIFEAHFAVPGCPGAVLHTINTRLDAATIAFQLNHAKTKVFMVDSEFGQLAKEALSLLPKDLKQPIVIDIHDPEYKPAAPAILCGDGKIKYEDFIARGDLDDLYQPEDEWDAIGLSYTSGAIDCPTSFHSSYQPFIQLNLTDRLRPFKILFSSTPS